MSDKFYAEKQAALKRFEALLDEQLKRAERIKSVKDFVDYQGLDKLIIGVCGGDGIGPYICKVSRDVLEYMLPSLRLTSHRRLLCLLSVFR